MSWNRDEDQRDEDEDDQDELGENVRDPLRTINKSRL
jgi:hypothetical protein